MTVTNFTGAVADVTKLPQRAQVGTAYFVDSEAAIFVYTGTTWCPLTGAERRDWVLFLDDERSPADARFAYSSASIVIARSTLEAQREVESRGLPRAMSLDHDLGGEDTAFKFLWWLINGHMDEKWNLGEIVDIQVHSANQVGAEKLMALWDNFSKHFKTQAIIRRVWPKEKNP